MTSSLGDGDGNDQNWKNELHFLLEKISSTKLYMTDEINEIDKEIKLFETILLPFVSKYNEYDAKIKEYGEEYINLKIYSSSFPPLEVLYLHQKRLYLLLATTVISCLK